MNISAQYWPISYNPAREGILVNILEVIDTDAFLVSDYSGNKWAARGAELSRLPDYEEAA